MTVWYFSISYKSKITNFFFSITKYSLRGDVKRKQTSWLQNPISPWRTRSTAEHSTPSIPPRGLLSLYLVSFFSCQLVNHEVLAFNTLRYYFQFTITEFTFNCTLSLFYVSELSMYINTWWLWLLQPSYVHTDRSLPTGYGPRCVTQNGRSI